MPILLSNFYPTPVSGIVYTTGNQNVSGIKNFDSRPTVRGTGVLLQGEAAGGGGPVILPSDILFTTGSQTITGPKNFTTARPTLSGLNLITTGDLVNLELNITGSILGSTLFSGNRPITQVPVLNQNYSGTTVTEFLNNMFFPFISASLVLNPFPIQEYGANTSAISFSHTLTRNSEPVNTITNMRYFRDETALTSNLTPIIGNSTSGPISLGVTANQNLPNLSIRVSINDNGNPKIISGVNTLFFQPRYYYGRSNLTTLNATQIRNNLTNSSPTFRPTDPRFQFTPTGEYIYFIYPNETKEGVTAWGNLTSIFDFGSNTENLGNFTILPDVVMTGVNNKTMTYKVYRSTLLLTIQGTQQFDLRFRF